ncbi:hypothetical protein I6B53_04290 [Schaalia sp. 19OD2882]|uniref:DUF6912 family protein n=1 Tax=Schaalia sp. 19OD2882 TaxID=2794089 RepID=UPI001C1F19A4|nr:hypothetical protein [Schaalia sp. 19OD2882]QWW20316.1 hypothetical protein I6B53_04290 [Schaalia sp. 19OD2882]
MRIFCPAISSDLSANSLAPSTGWTVVAPPGVRGEELEVLEDDAQTEAALASLEMLRDTPGNALRRIVLAVDVTKADVPEGEGVVEVAPGALGWADVVAVLVDGEEAEVLVKAVVEATEQDEADDAVAALWEEALEWYDVEEIKDLAIALL